MDSLNNFDVFLKSMKNGILKDIVKSCSFDDIDEWFDSLAQAIERKQEEEFLDKRALKMNYREVTCKSSNI